METTLELLDDIEEELTARSFLFVDPHSYRDGVEAATRAVRDLLNNQARPEIERAQP